MAYELTAHDRGLILIWKPGSDYVLWLCEEHGLFVKKSGEPGLCWCGDWSEKYENKGK